MVEQTHETWRSTIKGIVVVKKYDRRGDVKNESISGGQKFQITEEERAMNSELAASADLDVFKNGMLVPVRLLDGSESAAEIASNPNLMSESDMTLLFKAHWKTFESKLGQVSNPLTLKRLLEMAETEDVDATVRQLAAIKERLAVVAPPTTVERETIRPGGNPMGGPQVRMSSGLTPVTP